MKSAIVYDARTFDLDNGACYSCRKALREITSALLSQNHDSIVEDWTAIETLCVRIECRVRLFNNVGVLYERIGKAEAARGAFLRSFALVPTIWNTHNLMVLAVSDIDLKAAAFFMKKLKEIANSPIRVMPSSSALVLADGSRDSWTVC